jgi:hypothetical protein
MALQASGPIKFSDITTEFGTPPGRNLGAYRVSQSFGSLDNLGLDNEVNAGIVTTIMPQSETIKFSDFYGKKLNIIVDLYSIPQDSTRINAKQDRYNTDSIKIVGGFLPTKPNSTSGKKVFINVNRRIGSEKGNRNYVALKTGSWDDDTQLITVVGPNGELMGAGGDGGSGGGIRSSASAGNGGQGSSAFGIQYPTSIINQGLIFGGRGGGGGGAGGYGWTFADTQDGCEGRQNERLRVGGGGGAGGRGLPAGLGGPANTQYALNRGARVTLAGNGSSGSVSSNGSGGARGFTSGGNDCNRHARSGAGGGIESAGAGGDVSYNNRGSGGQRGYGIIIGSGGSIMSYSGNAEEGGRIDETVL